MVAYPRPSAGQHDAETAAVPMCHLEVMAFRRSILLALAAALLSAVLAGAAAPPDAAEAARRTKVAVGIGDQSPFLFSHPRFRALKLRKARYFVRWDAMRVPMQRALLDSWLTEAGRARVRPFVHVSTNDLRPKRAPLLSTARYRREVGRLVRHLRARGVRDVGVWNEANHKTQPTWRSPQRAAAYYRQMRRMCRGCTIVGLDVLDQAGVERYIRRFFRALPPSLRHRRIVVGIHNYSDTNRRRARGTRAIIRTVRRYDRRAKFWLTETGGVVNFGRAFPCNPRRAASRTAYMFTLARRYDRYLERLYAYNFFGARCNGFDAGLVEADGRLRPAYLTFKRKVASFAR
jgi:hypothetical protein